MGVASGCLLDAALSTKAAKILITTGWLYSMFIGLLLIFIRTEPIEVSPQESCFIRRPSYHIAARSAGGFSILMIIVMVILIQMVTFCKLKRRLNVYVGPSNGVTGLNRLYKRAMIKAALVGVCFSIGWVPYMVKIIMHDWSNGDVTLFPAPIPLLLAMLQGFSNALIFRAKHLRDFIKNKFSVCCPSLK